MRQLLNLAAAAALGVSALAAAPAPVLAADALYEQVPDHDGVCGDPRIQKTIQKRFRHQVTHVPHLPDVEIVQFRKIHQHRYKDRSKKWPIGRRYCGAVVDLTNGTSRDIWYLIEERMGFATFKARIGLADEVRGSNVEFCVSGYDRWNVYNGRCRILR